MPARTAHIAGSIQIDVPPEALFELVSDQRNEPRYNPSMSNVNKQTPGPVDVGTVFHAEMTSGRRATPMTIEVTGFERPRRLATATRLDTMTIDGALTLDPTPGGTRLRWSWDLQPKGVLAVAMPLVRWMGTRQERRIWAALKGYAEDRDSNRAQSRPQPRWRAPTFGIRRCVGPRGGGEVVAVKEGVHPEAPSGMVRESRMPNQRSEWTRRSAS